MNMSFENYYRLVIKCTIVFQASLNFDPVKEILKYNVTFTFQLNEESDFSEENTCNNEVFPSTILHHRQKLNIPFSCRFITYSVIRIGNLDWCKCGHWKYEATEIDCLCGRQVDTVLVASAKIPEREESVSLS